MPIRVTVISSMATKALLNELASSFNAAHADVEIQVESVGGVDAAKRVEAGEAFDVVALASNAIDKLAQGGHVKGDSKIDMVRSGVAVAVQAGAYRPDITTEAALKAAVLAAPTLGYSTGPSGVALAKLFERWGIAETIAPRIVTAPPGVPVGSLVAKGDVALGFQQYSELMSLPGIDILGGMPEGIQITTVFSAAVGSRSAHAELAQRWLSYIGSESAADIKRRNGMDPA